MNYKINTKLKTVKKVWNVLKECNLDGLLSGTTLDIKLNELLDTLLNENKLNELCQTITEQDIDFEELEIKEVAEILKSFFANTVGQFQEFSPNQTMQAPLKKSKN